MIFRSEEYDIYHDSNLKEILQVLPILTSFKDRLQQLLEEWPEHPTLVQVLVQHLICLWMAIWIENMF